MATYPLSFPFSSARVGLYARPTQPGPFPKAPADDAPSAGRIPARPADRRPIQRIAAKGGPGPAEARDKVTEALPSAASGPAPRRHHFPSLADTADVSGRASDGWDRGFAAHGGSRADFAEDLKRRLDQWRASGSGTADASLREFRDAVHAELLRALEGWAAPE